MRQEKVEIYSDITNAPILRHPERRFPGVLLQGDTLFSMCHQADFIVDKIGRNSSTYDEMNDHRNHLWSLLNQYKTVLEEHNIGLPFSEE